MEKDNTQQQNNNKKPQLDVSNVQLSFGMNKEEEAQSDLQNKYGSTGGFNNNFNILESVPIVIQGNQLSATWDQSSWEQISENAKNDQENVIPEVQNKKVVSIIESVLIDQEQFKKELDQDEITARRKRIEQNEAALKKENEQRMIKQQFNPDLLPLQSEVNQKKKDRMLKEHHKFETIRCVQLKEMENPITQKEPDKQQSTITKNNSIQFPDIVYESEGKVKILIGRLASNDIIINDGLKSISGKHSSLNWNETSNQWSLSDEGSTNGTFVQIDQTQIKQDDVFIIGLQLCKVVEIKKSFPIQVTLSFDNAAEKGEPVIITAKIQVGSKFFIGKKHQEHLQEDPFMEDDHCFIYFEGQKIKIQNCQGVFYKSAKKVYPKNPVDLIDGAIIRFGLVNQYFFLPYLKQIEVVITPDSQVQDNLSNNSSKVKKCSACGDTASSLYRLEPCNHQNICTKCASNEACPLCGETIKDFM